MGAILSAIAAVFKTIGAFIGMKDRADANRAGQDEQKVATLETTIEAQRKMNDANAAGPRTANDVDDKLRSGRF